MKAVSSDKISTCYPHTIQLTLGVVNQSGDGKREKEKKLSEEMARGRRWVEGVRE